MARQRRDGEDSKNLILDAVERLIHRDGYGVVNTRSAAIEAGFRPTLVHYHFETTENLLLAAYRRTVIRSEALLLAAVSSQRPLEALYNYNSDPVRTALATQFMALAIERPAIGREMAENVLRLRKVQAEAIAGSISSQELRYPGLTPHAAAMLISAVGRAFVMEETIGVELGHDDLRELLRHLIDFFEPATH